MHGWPLLHKPYGKLALPAWPRKGTIITWRAPALPGFSLYPPSPQYCPANCWRESRFAADRRAGVSIRLRGARPAGVVVGRHTGALPPQLFHACPDRREIIGGAGSGHVSSGVLFSRAKLDARQIGKLWLTEQAALSSPIEAFPNGRYAIQ
jgi:hypothetical protein